ncbi:MAG: UvrD-helicase domain-containing protein [Gammaproteobacteria bacterium]
MNANSPERKVEDVQRELREAIDRIVTSRSSRKLVVAGPGAGKTTLFRILLEQSPGSRETRLVLTFINNLKQDMERSLGGLARVFTLHGYCQSLLHRHAVLRTGLTQDFVCQPGLNSIVKSDWRHLYGAEPPAFANLMRNLVIDPAIDFFISRANYYDAVDFDDSVYRSYLGISANPEVISGIDLVLIDEYQDFNRMEAAVIELLAQQNPIVVAGDDDQALYSQLRGASCDHIRAIYIGDKYEKFTLPFCMRCPEVIVNSVNDVISAATKIHRLRGRIEKPFRHFEPVKGEASRQYPNIALVTTSVQRRNPNYFGRYIVEALDRIPHAEIAESRDKGEPTVLIIASNPYRRQIEEYLTSTDRLFDASSSEPSKLRREEGIAILKVNESSNLGWRIVGEFEEDDVISGWLRDAQVRRIGLFHAVPAEYRARILEEAVRWEPMVEDIDQAVDHGGPTIRVTSFEGAKGLSAQQVFIVGMHDGELPHDSDDVKDIEICRLLVGLTRTKKKCTLLKTRRFGDVRKRPSPFLSWIDASRYEQIYVDAAYWRRE